MVYSLLLKSEVSGSDLIIFTVLFCAAKVADNQPLLISYDKHFAHRSLGHIRRRIRRGSKPWQAIVLAELQNKRFTNGHCCLSN